MGSVDVTQPMNGADLAELLGVDPKTLRRWRDAGGIKCNSRGLYAMPETLRAAIDHLLARDRKVSALESEKVRHERAKAEAVERKNAAESGELVPVSEVLADCAFVVNAVRSQFLGLPEMMQLQAGIEPYQAKVCRDLVHKALGELSAMKGDEDVGDGASDAGARRTEPAAEDAAQRVGG